MDWTNKWRSICPTLEINADRFSIFISNFKIDCKYTGAGYPFEFKKLTAIIYEVETDRAYVKASSSKGISDFF